MCVKEGGGEHWSVLHAPFFCTIHLKRPSDFIGQLLPYFSTPCLAISLRVLQINSTNILIIKQNTHWEMSYVNGLAFLITFPLGDHVIIALGFSLSLPHSLFIALQDHVGGTQSSFFNPQKQTRTTEVSNDFTSAYLCTWCVRRLTGQFIGNSCTLQYGWDICLQLPGWTVESDKNR